MPCTPSNLPDHSHFGQTWVSSAQWGLLVQNGYTGPFGTGIIGKTDSPDNGRGVAGMAMAGVGTNYGVYGRADSADGYGGYFINNGGGAALYAAGDVVQDAAADGLAKAAVYAYCANQSSSITRFFNTVSGNVTIDSSAPPTDVGTCDLHFGFNVAQRYWVALAVTNNNPHSVSCLSHGDVNELWCRRWDANGSHADGMIMVLVY